jgi:hypothetical protein
MYTIDDLQNFGVFHGVDFIAASFVRKGSDIDFIRQVLGPKGANIKVSILYLTTTYIITTAVYAYYCICTQYMY